MDAPTDSYDNPDTFIDPTREPDTTPAANLHLIPNNADSVMVESETVEDAVRTAKTILSADGGSDYAIREKNKSLQVCQQVGGLLEIGMSNGKLVLIRPVATN